MKSTKIISQNYIEIFNHIENYKKEVITNLDTNLNSIYQLF